MQTYYALYDQSFANGPQYWTWFAPELDQSVRNAAASRQGAFQTRPKNANQLADTDILGGILCVGEDWFVVYRFFNGGYDPQGRPGRGVMATAWVRRLEADGADLYSLLRSPAFRRVQELAPDNCPIPAPENLTEILTDNLSGDWPERVDVQAPRYEPLMKRYDFRDWSFAGSESESGPESEAESDSVDVQTFAELFPELAKRGVVHLKIVQTGRPLVTFSEEPLTSAVIAVESPIPDPMPKSKADSLPEPEQKPEPKSFLPFLLTLLTAFVIALVFSWLTRDLAVEMLHRILN